MHLITNSQLVQVRPFSFSENQFFGALPDVSSGTEMSCNFRIIERFVRTGKILLNWNRCMIRSGHCFKFCLNYCETALIRIHTDQTPKRICPEKSWPGKGTVSRPVICIKLDVKRWFTIMRPLRVEKIVNGPQKLQRLNQKHRIERSGIDSLWPMSHGPWLGQIQWFWR